MVPNAFPTYVEEEDSPTQTCSSGMQSLIYYILCGILIIVLGIFYALTPGAIEIVVSEPSYSNFLTV